MNTHPIIVWFRSDLRVADNPALFHAAGRGHPVIPLFILEEDLQRPMGGASKLWLHHSLKALQQDLPGLVIRKGKANEVIESLIEESGASAVYWNRRYGRDRTRDALLKETLNATQDLQVFNTR